MFNDLAAAWLTGRGVPGQYWGRVNRVRGVEIGGGLSIIKDAEKLHLAPYEPEHLLSQITHLDPGGPNV